MSSKACRWALVGSASIAMVTSVPVYRTWLRVSAARCSIRPRKGDPDRRLRDDRGGDDPGRLFGGSARPPRGDVVAALGIVVPSLRRDKSRLVSALTVAAHGIARTLGPTA